MSSYETSIAVKAPALITWAQISDVCEWPGWLPTVTSVEPLQGRSLDLGHRFRIEQPRLRPAIWTVTKIVPGESFVWEASSPGVVAVAEHRVKVVGRDECTVTLRLFFEGLLSWLASLAAGRLTREYIEREAQALRAAAERQHGATQIKYAASA
jgi:ribosome-associated toxin RatA of RatAB toxin-antitoxin module